MTEKISLRQYMCLVIMFSLGSFIVSHGSRDAKQDTWIIILVGFIIVLPQLFIIAYINKNNPSLNVYQTFKKNFGKIIGSIFTIYFTLAFIVMAILLLRLFGEYIRVSALRQTPLFIILTLIMIPSFYAASFNTKVITKLACFLFLMFIIVFIITSLFSISIIKNIENMMPIFHLNQKEFITYSLESYMNPFYECFIFLVIPRKLKDNTSHYKVLFFSYLISTLILSYNSLRNILILATPAYQNLYFPSYISNTVLSSGTMLERLELMFSFFFIFSMYIKLILLIKAPVIGIKEIFNKVSERLIAIIISIIILITASVYFINMEHFFEVCYGNLRTYINFGILFIIILVLISTIINSKRYKKEYELAF